MEESQAAGGKEITTARESAEGAVGRIADASLPSLPPSLAKRSPLRSASQGTEKGEEECGQWIWWCWGRHTLGKWE